VKKMGAFQVIAQFFPFPVFGTAFMGKSKPLLRERHTEFMLKGYRLPVYHKGQDKPETDHQNNPQ